MFTHRHITVAAAAMALAAVTAASVTQAQVPAVQRAGFHLPPGQVAAPNTPGGAVVVGNRFYASDQVNGFRHYAPADPANADPINTGILVFDTDQNQSLGGTALCVLFCSVGQIAYDGNETVYVASYDHPKGQPFSLTVPGIWRLRIDPLFGLEPVNQLAPKAGLPGNLPTSIALGPDGNLYVGFLKNGNVVRIVNPTANLDDPAQAPTQIVQSVGTAPDGVWYGPIAR